MPPLSSPRSLRSTRAVWPCRSVNVVGTTQPSRTSRPSANPRHRAGTAELAPEAEGAAGGNEQTVESRFREAEVVYLAGDEKELVGTAVLPQHAPALRNGRGVLELVRRGMADRGRPPVAKPAPHDVRQDAQAKHGCRAARGLSSRVLCHRSSLIRRKCRCTCSHHALTACTVSASIAAPCLPAPTSIAALVS